MNRLRRQHPELASQVPEIGKMVDFRNFLIHEYHRVDPEIVWRIVKDNLPDLQITNKNHWPSWILHRTTPTRNPKTIHLPFLVALGELSSCLDLNRGLSVGNMGLQ